VENHRPLMKRSVTATGALNEPASLRKILHFVFPCGTQTCVWDTREKNNIRIYGFENGKMTILVVILCLATHAGSFGVVQAIDDCTRAAAILTLAGAQSDSSQAL
jgi:hypothetical protein